MISSYRFSFLLAPSFPSSCLERELYGIYFPLLKESKRLISKQDVSVCQECKTGIQHSAYFILKKEVFSPGLFPVSSRLLNCPALNSTRFQVLRSNDNPLLSNHVKNEESKHSCDEGSCSMLP